MNKNNKKAIKHYICGAISAFSVVAAYKAYKSIKNKKQNAVDTSNNYGHYYGTSSNSLHTIKFDRSKLNTPNSFQFGESGKGRAFRMDHEERILQPKHIAYNKEYIEDRKALIDPSGFVISSSHNKEKAFFKHEINNVLNNSDDKIVIFNAAESADSILWGLDANYEVDYKDITEEDLDVARKYDYCSIEKTVAPLTERVTVFNADCSADIGASILYAFIKARATSRSECQYIWFFIPEFPSSSFSKELQEVRKRSRMAGVIVTASVVAEDLIFNDDIRNINRFSEFIVITDDIGKYNETYHIDLKKR